jgi:hypothetical protein
MKQSGEIAASLQSLFVSNALLTAAIPGGLIWGTVKSGTTYPFAAIDITLGNTEWMTGNAYTQDYFVTIEVWDHERIATVDTIQHALETLIGVTTKLSMLINAYTLQCILLPSDIDEDPERNLGDMTLIARMRYQITLQEQRRT